MKSMYSDCFSEVRFVVTRQCTPAKNVLCANIDMNDHAQSSVQHSRYGSWIGAFSDSRCNGVLFFHMDMFVHARLLQEHDVTRNWVLRNGFPRGGSSPKCFQASSTIRNEWFWWDNSKRLCSEASVRTNITRCCYGWSDMFYIARPYLGRAASLFSEFKNVHHEVAVPTVLHSLSTPLLLSCRGGCCRRGVMPGVVTHCAHRVDLTSVRVRNTLLKLQRRSR